jgi:hypothetical protein
VALPHITTVFKAGLDGADSRLKYFNNKVEGDCFFNSVKTLEEIGPNAEFGGDLNCAGTSIKKFNNKVKGSCVFYGVRTLTEIGTNAEFGGNLDCEKVA